MAGFNFSHKPKDVPLVNTEFRKIITKIPTPESVEMLEKAYKLESRSMHGQMPVVWDRAENFQVFDAHGNCWIDFTSTIFVANAGHSNPRIIDAVSEVIKKPLLHTYTYLSPERLDYLGLLIDKTPKQFEKVFMLSAGTEATECALKLMRENGIINGKKRGGIICLEGNWHGRTMGAQMMGWNPNQKTWIGYNDPNIFHVPFPYPWDSKAMENPKKFFKDAMDRLCKHNDLDPKTDLCGFMVESFQGWGAVFYPPEFIQALSEFSKEHNMLLTFDEMQSGFGRTGELFGYMHYDVEPDLLCCGKGASSGFPLALVLGSADILDLPDIGSMSSTHSANPIVCAAGKANLQCLFEDGLIENSKELGAVFHKELKNIKSEYNDYLYWVEGKGLVAALIFKDRAGKPLVSLCDMIAERCMQRGLLVVHTGRESIKLAPPLSISYDALLEGISVLKQSIADVIMESKYD
jgi:4-aminobutyrate aminotransferase-like enzyme